MLREPTDLLALRGVTSNQAFYLDADLNGVISDAEVSLGRYTTDMRDLVASAIPVTGSSMNLIVSFNLDAGDEEFALDNMVLEGVTPQESSCYESGQVNPVVDGDFESENGWLA